MSFSFSLRFASSTIRNEREFVDVALNFLSIYLFLNTPLETIYFSEVGNVPSKELFNFIGLYFESVGSLRKRSS